MNDSFHTPERFTNRAVQKNCNELCLFRSTETVPLRTEILKNFPEILTGSCYDVSSSRRHILERETERDREREIARARESATERARGGERELEKQSKRKSKRKR